MRTVYSPGGWQAMAGCCQIKSADTRNLLVITLVDSRLSWLPIVSMEDANLSPNTCLLLAERGKNTNGSFALMPPIYEKFHTEG